jgi:methylenetetrahydrofolate reductase (NADPH)
VTRHTHAGGSNLRRLIEQRRFAITAEVTPPVSAEPERLLEKALPLKGYADAVNVTDAASARSTMSSVAAAAILVQEGIEPVLQVTCRDRNRIALQNDLLGAAALGIRNVLVLTGDDPKAGDQPDAKAVFDLDSKTLIGVTAGLRKGELMNGRKVQGSVELFIGAADLPVDPPPGWAPNSLEGKVAAGAEFAQTQFCMDMGVVRRYMGRLAEHGLSERVGVLIGIAPLASAKSARWMRQHLFGTIIPDEIVARMEAAADPRAEGRRICVELLQELAEIPGVAGAHIMAPLNEAAIPEVVAESGLLSRR